MLALVVGKPLGIVLSTWLVQRFTGARLADGLSWWDVLGVGLLGGIGFTVSLLISELAFGLGTALGEQGNSASWPARCSRPCSLPSCCAAATATTGGPRRLPETFLTPFPGTTFPGTAFPRTTFPGTTFPGTTGAPR